MADYRDELRAAHERIAQLEGQRPPPPKKDRTVLLIVALVLGAVVVAGGMFLAIMSSLSVDGSDVFVIMNQTLHVFDARTGVVKMSRDDF